jgi:uncharacterized protein YfaS (alpha-2-macroglobulin family)
VLLPEANTWGLSIPLLRMWENLVGLPAPREDVLEIGSLILIGRAGPPVEPLPRPRRWRSGLNLRVHPGQDAGTIARRVSLDLLSLEAPPWLAAEAHLRLGILAEQANQLGEAERRYELAAAAADEKESAAVSEARSRLSGLRAPELFIHADGLYRPGSEHLLALRWRNLEAWRLEVRRVDPQDESHLSLPTSIREQRRRQLSGLLRSDRGELVHERRFVDELELEARESGGEQAGSGRDEEPGSSQPHERRSEKVWLRPLEVGVYVATLHGEGFDDAPDPEPSSFAFVVSDLGLTFQRTNDPGSGEEHLELWLVEMREGTPVPNTELTIHVAAREDRRILWTQTATKTDRNGLAQVDLFQLGPADDRDMVLVLGSHEGRPVAAAAWGGELSGPSHLRDALSGFVLSDRPLYRPGETVHLQAFVRRKDFRRHQTRVPEDLQMRLQITAPDGSSFHDAELRLDANGSAELELGLPSRPPLGQYRIQLSSPELKDHDRYRSLITGTFQVDEYRLPEFSVRVELDAERRYVLGDTLEVLVESEYLFGGPVHGEVDVVVRRQPRWVIWQPHRHYGWLRESVGARRPSAVFAPEGGVRIVPPDRGAAEEVLRLSGSLDDRGRFRVEIPTSARENDPQDYEYVIEARVTDSSRREESARGTTRVTRQELYAFLSPLRWVLAPSDEARITLRVQDAMDRPVATAGTWSVWLQKESREKDQILVEPEQILSRNVRTAEDGELLLSFEPSRVGHYLIRFETRDDRGNSIEASTAIWCADPKTRTITHGAGGLQLIAEQDEFLGDVARVLLVSDTAGSYVYLSRHFAHFTVSEMLRLSGTVQLLEIPIDDLHRPYFWLRAASARDWRLQEATLQIIATAAEHVLDVALSFGQEHYLPGEQASLGVLVKDANGNPSRTPLTIAVIDDAILQLMPRSLPDPARLFHGFEATRPRDLRLSAGWLGGFKERHPDDGEPDEDFERGGRSSEIIQHKYSMAEGDNAFRADGAQIALADQPPMGALLPAAPEEGLVGAGAMAPLSVRTDFRTTALWRTAVMTDEQGRAQIEVPLAESLTRWNALAVAVNPSSAVGMGETSTRTRKQVMVRLNHPRVFRERDRFTLAATVHNETDAALQARVGFESETLQVAEQTRSVSVPSHGQTRVEWEAEVPAGSAGFAFERNDSTGALRILPGEALVRVLAETSVESDAFERRIRLFPWGSPLRLAASTEVRGDAERATESATLSLALPADRVASAELATLTLSPSVLSACVDALPFLADYPYGCVEQTLSRFVPALAVRHAVRAMGAQSQRLDPELDDKVRDGLQRIAEAQLSDGGWGWWPDAPESDPYMTAYVMLALSQAVQAEVSVDRSMFERGKSALRSLLPRLRDLRRADDLAYGLYAMTRAQEAVGGSGAQPLDTVLRRFATDLFRDRDQLRPYARALLASTLNRAQDEESARLLLRHLENDVQVDREVDTVHWGQRRNFWWRGEGAVEATAFALQAYLEIEPEHENARRTARWLVANRRGARWDNTRATAHAIFALVAFARQSGELDADYTAIASLRGVELARLRITSADLIDGGGTFPLSSDVLRDGQNLIELRLEGTGTCYLTVAIDTYSQASRIEAGGHWLEIERQFIRLRPLRTLGGSILQIEEPLAEGDLVESGDRVRVKLRITAHQDIDYVALEDPRPAGMEPVDRLSGWSHDRGLSARREVRDELGAFFFGRIPEGEHEFSYELRAESPGLFHVAPVRIYGMYLPDVAGHSASTALRIAAEEG